MAGGSPRSTASRNGSESALIPDDYKLRGVRLVTYSAHGRTCVGEVVDDRVHELDSATMLDWLKGKGRARSGASNALADVALRAPVPEPSSLRDFFSFEGHVAAAWRLRGE